MNLIQIVVLAVVQGAAELLPVSSSAHVIVAEKLMGLDPTAPQMTLMLVMLHTGTMLAVILYFWPSWRHTYFTSLRGSWVHARAIAVASLATAAVGVGLMLAIKRIVAGGSGAFEIEQLFGSTPLIAGALAAAGVLIIASSRIPARDGEITFSKAGWIGAIQGLCLPFRGFSRSGATISTGMALGVARRRAEEFSFALAVVLTPAVIGREVYRVYRDTALSAHGLDGSFVHLAGPSLLGMGLSFITGLLALRWLSSWLEQGRWYLFGLYCLAASVFVYTFA